MITDRFGQQIYREDDLFDLFMRGRSPESVHKMITTGVDLSAVRDTVEHLPDIQDYVEPNVTLTEFDRQCQHRWMMPDKYRDLDIAKHVLSLCNNPAELQRCGHELLLYQERGLFDLLRYLTYLVDVMKQNRIIWGVGRGSSVASFVLFKLGVHRIDSLYYSLEIEEFLR